MAKTSPKEIAQQMRDNITWIKGAKANKLVVGSQARILYADCEGRTKIAIEFNKAIEDGGISAPIVLGRDHHDVSGTDSPFRETSNIYDGSSFTADMAIHNVIGDSFREQPGFLSIMEEALVGRSYSMEALELLLMGSLMMQKEDYVHVIGMLNNGISKKSGLRNEVHICNKRVMESEGQSLKGLTILKYCDEGLIRNSIYIILFITKHLGKYVSYGTEIELYFIMKNGLPYMFSQEKKRLLKRKLLKNNYEVFISH